MTRRELVTLLTVVDRLPVCRLRWELEALVLEELVSPDADDYGRTQIDAGKPKTVRHRGRVG